MAFSKKTQTNIRAILYNFCCVDMVQVVPKLEAQASKSLKRFSKKTKAVSVLGLP